MSPPLNHGDAGTCAIMHACVLCLNSSLCPCSADVVECDGDPAPCHVTAICIDSIGSYSCQCNTGYSGDGVTQPCASKSDDVHVLTTGDVKNSLCDRKPLISDWFYQGPDHAIPGKLSYIKGLTSM